jgi:hypothetical protein
VTAPFATLTRQCWLFAIGSSFFAVATVPGFPMLAGAGAANVLCFVGSWFFTTAGWMQYALALRGIQWWSAAIQFMGTVLFNVSTAAAVLAHAVLAERRYVWAPDATGSLAFLASGLLAVLAVGLWSPKSVDWRASWTNMIGCVAFAISALAAFVSKTGVTEDAWLANVGTFVGALCFFAAAVMIAPRKA